MPLQQCSVVLKPRPDRTDYTSLSYDAQVQLKVTKTVRHLVRVECGLITETTCRLGDPPVQSCARYQTNDSLGHTTG